MSWYSRAWIGLTSPVLRLFGVGKVADVRAPIVLGSDYAAYVPAIPSYDPRTAESATARFPWVHAALNRKAGDLARLPWMATVGGYGRAGKPAAGHPILAIIERPNSAEPGSLFWRQVYSELWKTGQAFAIKVRDGRGRWIGLIWMPTARFRPVSGPSGFPTSFYNTLNGVTYAAEDVLHWRLPGSIDTPQHLTGTGYMEPLGATLDAEERLKARLAQASKQGRPVALATPDTDLGVLGADQIKDLRTDLDELFRETSGGLAILGARLKVDPLDWKPVDLDAGEQLDRSRTEQLGVIGVPPVRVGLETANYATAQQQGITYWGDELQAESALFDDVLTMHARAEFGPPDLYVGRDFTDVPALAAHRDAALERASKHILNGMAPAAAYKLEHIDGVNPGDFEAAPAAQAPKDAPDEPAVEPGKVVPIRSWWDDPPVAVSRRVTFERASDADRAAMWRSWLRRAHTPTETALRRAAAPILRAQAAHVAASIERMMTRGARSGMGRNAIDELVNALFPASDASYWTSFRPRLLDAIAVGVREGSAQVAVTPDMDAARLDLLTDHQLAELVTQTSATTRAGLRAYLTAAIADGASVDEMRDGVRKLAVFSPGRALAIARTETTGAIGAGTEESYRGAIAAGARIKQGWLSARDSHVRDAHLLLDGLTVEVGAPFVIPAGPYAGQSARWPGDFPLAALVVNCRCTTVAVDE